jgi:peptidyl-dipeptidase Dcp
LGPNLVGKSSVPVWHEAGDAFDPQLAARLKAIYSAGDTRDPMELYCTFRGREPAISALLEQRGLAAAPAG